MVVKDTHKDRIEDNNGNNSGESDSDHKNDTGIDIRHGFESRNGIDSRNGTDRGNDAITERLESSIEQEEDKSEQEPEAIDLVR